jgi:outer membrane receptor protein involved in Fe transport
VDPGAQTCEPLSTLYGGELTYSFRPANGFYCGTASAGYNSIISEDTQLNTLVSAQYHFTDAATAYTQILYGRSEPTYSNGLPSWSTTRVTDNISGYIWNQNTQRAESLQRIYSPEEIASWHNRSQHVHAHALNGSIGLKGRFGDSGVHYDAYFHYSQENTHYVSFNGNYVNQRATAYYLGPRLGTTSEGYPIFAPNLERFYAPITPEQYESFTGARSEYSVSWTEDATVILNDSALFSLPAGNVGAAVIAQVGTDKVHAPLDPNAAAGVFDGTNARPNSAGSRDHYAFGSEWRVPILRLLTADLSGRYDRYDYEAGTGFGGANGSGKFTYRGGLEFRPYNDVLVRASYATAFRTPDLYYLFEGPTGSFANRTDWYQCRLAGYTSRNIDDCALSGGISPLTVSSGSTALQNITAKSYTYGIVWSPLDNQLRLSVDYSRVDIRNKVQQIDIDALLQQEADCRLGVSEGGQTFDIKSPTCQDALTVIERQDPAVALDPLSVTLIHSVPTNIALEHQAGIQTEARYSWGTERFGDYSVSARHFRQLDHTTKNFPADEPLDLLCCANNDEFFHTTSLDAVWNFGKFSTTLHGTRYAPTWTSDSSSRNVGPWTIFNGSERYDITDSLFTQVIVNNIADKRPPNDPTNISFPYYSPFSYNSYGRAYWLEFGVKFGGRMHD